MSAPLRIVAAAAAALLILALVGLLAWGLLNRTSPTGLSGFTRVGRPAPDFLLQSFDDGEILLSRQRGKVVVINFWSSTCPPCRAEASELESAWRAYQDRGVLFVGANIEDSREPAQRFLREFDVTYPNGPDEDGRITIDYGVVGIPVTFLVDEDGIVARRWVGAIDRGQLAAWIDELLQGAPPDGETEGIDEDTYYRLDEL